MGQTHLGITDHGRLGGVLDHIHACRHPETFDVPDDPGRKRSKDERLIPIVGIEAFWRPNRFMDLSDTETYGKNGHNWAQHLCVHAGSLRGWRTLMRLSSKSWVPREDGGGFYGKACFDWDMLEHDHEDIIISTACLSSPLSQLILAGAEEEAIQWCEDMISIVGPNSLFLEIMPHDLQAQREVNIGKINIANELGLPFMVTGDVHMPYKSWISTQAIVRMAAYRTSISKQERKSDAGEDVYTDEIDTIFLSSEDELKGMFAKNHPEIPDAVVQEGLDNTVEFARQFRGYVIGKTPKLPNVTKSKQEAERVIKQWCSDGMDRVEGQLLNRLDYDRIQHVIRMQTYQERYEYEFGVLKGKGVLDYFILVGDFVRWAKSDEPLPGDSRKKRPIRVGLGRGSAAGCLISYLIGITAIDPIAWGLLFERFLNPDRVGLPDIDIDVETEIPIMEVNGVWLDGREMVIEYLKRKYGHDHVASIIAYQTFAPRAVIKAVSDTQDIDFIQTKKVTDAIGDTDRDLVKIAVENETVAKFRDEHPEIWEHCLRLEDQILRDSRHAGGIVITKKPTNYYMPTQIGSDEKSIVTAWADRMDFPIVSDYGLLKNDILGVKGLAKQELAVQLIKDHYGDNFEPNDLPVLRDPYDTEQDVIDAFVQGLTLGVFQFGSRGITNLLRHIKPDNSIDIAVANALYRPGPIKIAFEYGDRKNGKVPVTYWHDALEPILKETLGIIAFQEQVMEITKQIGKFTGGQADSMRKAISKLYRLPGDEARNFMQGFYEQWMQGCRVNGLKDSDAILIWDRILEFAGYGFNKTIDGLATVERYTTNQHDLDPNITLQEIWERFYGSKRSTPVGKKYRSRGLWIRGYDAVTGRITKKRVIDIHDHGVLKLYKMTLDNGMSVSATLNHRHLTPDGWTTVGALRVGDEVVVDTKVQDATLASAYRPIIGRGKTKAWVATAIKHSMTTGKVILHGQHAALATVTKELPDHCEWCGANEGRLERAHLDDDRSNNTRENVVRLCNSCHKTHDGHLRGGPWSRGSIAGVAKIVKIEYDGQRQAYDLEIDGATEMDHNFAVNGGIVTHNSHSASYGLQAYQDMHIKEHYPLAFYASLLTIEKKSKRDEQVDFLKGVMREAVLYDVEVDPPDVNRSDRGWSIDGDRIRYGLVSISGMGGAAAELVIKNRPFDSFFDFVTRMPSNFGTDSTFALAKAGAFDGLVDRSYILSRTRQWPETIAKYKINMTCGCKKTKQVKLDDKMRARVVEEFVVTATTTTRELMEMATEIVMDELECPKHPIAEVKDYDELDPFYPITSWHKDHPTTKPDEIVEPSHNEVIAMEQEALNVPLSLRSLLNQYKEFVEERIYTEQEVDELPSKPQRKGKEHGASCTCQDCVAAHVIIGGEVTNVKTITTKKKKEQMAFVDIAFGVNQWSVTLFPYVYRQFSHLLKQPTVLLIAGHKDERGSILAYDIKDVLDVADAEGYKPPAIESGDVIDMGGGVKGMVIAPSKSVKPKLKIRTKAAA